MDNESTASQLKLLRSEGRALRVSASVGKAGMTDAVAGQVAALLGHHHLVKARLPAASKSQRVEMAEELAARTGSTVIDLVGRMVVLYRPPSAVPSRRSGG